MVTETLDEKFNDYSWEGIKKYIKNKAGNGEIFSERNIDWEFPINKKKQIEGKPQLIEETKRNIVLAREVKIKDKKDKDIERRKIVLIGENFDKRKSKEVISTFQKYFFLYKVVDKDKKQYFILSKKELPNEVCTFTGMNIEAEDFAEISRSLRIDCVTSIFFIREYKSSVETLPPKELLEFVKSKNMNEENWLKLLAYHKTYNSYNRFPKLTEIFKSAFILSGKVDGYPLHLGVIGQQGSRKSKGFIETIAQKMYDKPDVVEGANSRLKGLIPSFKEKPANLGYMANAHRMGWIDELGKMVEFEMNRHDGISNNILGEINFLLEHTTRQVSSGNDNTATVKSSAKFTMVLNPVKRKTNISQHVGIIDPTTMSRMIWWCQNTEEQDFAMSEKGIIKIRNDAPEKQILETTQEFLTIYDSCNSFTCKIDYEKLTELYHYTVNLTEDPMKNVWKPRAEHHIELIIDGVCKHRCLFIDYDENFEANEKDYALAKEILTHMIASWKMEYPKGYF